MTIQGEVMAGTILQQTFVVEYVVNHQMCDDCRRVEAKDTWNASVQVRQKTSQRKTLYFLEQIYLLRIVPIRLALYLTGRRD